MVSRGEPRLLVLDECLHLGWHTTSPAAAATVVVTAFRNAELCNALDRLAKQALHLRPSPHRVVDQRPDHTGGTVGGPKVKIFTFPQADKGCESRHILFA
jgi:hypothetical protein